MSNLRPSVFSYSDYRAFVRDLIKTYPKGGHGQFRRMADALRTNTVTISQIFKGKRDLSLDQAYEVSEFLGLNEKEREFFRLLVDWSRSYLPRYRNHLEAQIQKLRKEALDLNRTLPKVEKISDEARARFYSDWRYSAVRLLISIPKFQESSKISQVLQIEMNQLSEILDFLARHDLIQKKGTKFVVGKASTHLEAGSPFVKHRQLTWRLKAHEYMNVDSQKSNNLFFTGPCSIAEKNFDAFREELNAVVKKFISKLESDPPESLACLNIDFFRMT